MSKAVRVALIVLLLTLSSDIAAALTPGNVSFDSHDAMAASGQ